MDATPRRRSTRKAARNSDAENTNMIRQALYDQKVADAKAEGKRLTTALSAKLWDEALVDSLGGISQPDFNGAPESSSTSTTATTSSNTSSSDTNTRILAVLALAFVVWVGLYFKGSSAFGALTSK
eukprot:CAMPEP_0175140992 /NCGR_PEP_ID=MMETSP0087-20121206/11830_1 /TAXON_ID=136419 /ORGANISM="Unknown Unknown, Strain D1" /LENGTH=125 /DNA_ID=CAMNT_0016424303 /DNA_START=50 /DNA_END=427 /DNA_ORIENTATION=-